MEEDGQQQEKTVPVGGVKTITLTLFSAVLLMILKVIALSTNFSTNGTSYQRVCGRARGYQKGNTHAFYPYHRQNQDLINDYYADGLLIAYGNSRLHILTYAVTYKDNST